MWLFWKVVIRTKMKTYIWVTYIEVEQRSNKDLIELLSSEYYSQLQTGIDNQQEIRQWKKIYGQNNIY